VNNLSVPGAATTPGPNGTLVVDAYQLDFSSVVGTNPNPYPGPQIGVLILTQQRGAGHLITGYQPCPAG